ncbi:hypothetical protein VB602_06410 [Vibrio parahaemolyticus]|uniref:Type 4a pilus biogenesis protein PilO n=1 Tax=Vibrio parahaemolyticus TaxID=670 RepID=A0A7M1WNJ6_VIBPH|nr:hypothetical protein [Vibrio parahaemolyticus]MBE4374441.1 hypothetical protein [Vibrio parahaemolyticus]MBE4430296.1 hypothetical protein [Vibrio parahaemolyticus]MEA5235926.1 hypothetical protein [Vibrio parahaemolyticus]OLF43146.1 hypothetical protein BUQ66_18720 [Vibrio parahaemolyticus]QOS28551.1 hypothetical protein VP53_00021 [Vibrio parahaemolyticus]
MDKQKIGLVTIAILVALKFIAVPWFDWVSVTSESVAQKSATYSRFGDLDTQKELAAEQIEELNLTKEKILASELNAERAELTTELFALVNQIGQQVGIEVNGLVLGEFQNNRVSYVPLRFRASGSAEKMTLFINAIENSEPKLVTAEAVLTKERVEGRLTMNVTLYATLKGEEHE